MVTTMPRGVVTAMVTPMDGSGHLDVGSLERLIVRSLDGGVVGLSPCGSTGEGARLSARERVDVARRVRAYAPDVPVVPGVPVTAVPTAEEELAELGNLGATAALVAPPAYYPMSEADVVRLYTDLADRSPIPLLLYNIPAFTGVVVSPDAAARLAVHARVVGIKDSSRDLEYLQSVIRAVAGAEDFVVYTGTDTLLVASMLVGADGAVTASSNLVPGWGVEIIDAVAAGNLDRAGSVQDALVQVVEACRRGALPSGWKHALHLAGVCRPDVVSPGSNFPMDKSSSMQGDLVAAGVEMEPPR